MDGSDKIIILAIFIACYALALSRKVKIAYASLGAAALLMILGYLTPAEGVFKAVKWDVMGIYWGFMMVSYVFMQSRMPELIANRILCKVRVERWAILSLCAFTAFLSAFMENVGVVLMMAPVAIAVSKTLKSSLFHYLIAIAISSNVVTTVTMVADPPPIILAMETGMKPLDFYYFMGRLGLGTITLVGVLVAMATLLYNFRWMDKIVQVTRENVPVTKGASVLFVVGVAALVIGPEFGIRPGIVGLVAGVIALIMGHRELHQMLVEFDWNSFLFILGVFMVIYTLNSSGLLEDFAEGVVQSGFNRPAGVLAFLTWISVALSSFMDNVPYTILMIPVCKSLAASLGIAAWPLLYGMLIGTGIGGNITPVGATANVFAIGILEKQGYKVALKEYLKISVPFSIAAVLTAHILIQLIWL
jgi:Na+/H+ antiporter NhaD/arsenite permease-like protein